MSAFKLRIETGNAAFDDGNANAEIARILRELATLIQQQGTFLRYDHIETGRLRDVNGNRVGTWEWK